MSEPDELDDVAQLRSVFSNSDAVPGFTARAIDIPGDLRVAWRLAVLCVLLRRGRSNSLLLEHLHVLWWAVRSEATRSLLTRWVHGESRPDEVLVRFDPSLTITLDLAIGQGLVAVQGSGALKLTSSGLAFAEEVLAAPEVLKAEKAFLSGLPSRITQRQIQELLEWK